MKRPLNKIEMPAPAAVALPMLEDESKLRAGVTVADLIHAAANGFSMIVRCVLMAGIDPNEKDAQGRTALMVAATKEIRDLLLEAGAQSVN
jgi:ankyrin repeat protein